MIAPWLLETLSREWNWRAALRRIAGELASRSPSPLSVYPRDHALACADVARALEHVEPDRRFAIASYQQAGPEHDDGRALALAIEAGWWPVVCNLAMRERTATGSLEAMVWEARALLDTGERERADKLLPITPSDARLASLRAELAGGQLSVYEHWLARARAWRGADASEAYLIAARQARALGREDWVELLREAAVADPGHAGVVAMMIDQSFGDGRRDSRSLLEHLRQRLTSFEERGDLSAWCDATRLAAMRLWLGSGGERHRGLARRLLAAALERAYREGVTEISGHLAMWAVLDEAAAADQTRTELLGLVVNALDVNLPVGDRIWLAALGAEICAEAANLQAAHAYAAVVVDLAPHHPVVRDYFEGTVAAVMPAEHQLEAFKDALLSLDVEPWQELQIDEVAPLSLDEIGLAPGVVAPEQAAVAIEDALERAVPVMDGDEVAQSEYQNDEDWTWQPDLGAGLGVGTGTERALEEGTAWPVGKRARAETVESGPIGTRDLRGQAGRVHARAETVESGPVGTRSPSAPRGAAVPAAAAAAPTEPSPAQAKSATAQITKISARPPAEPAAPIAAAKASVEPAKASVEPAKPPIDRRSTPIAPVERPVTARAPIAKQTQPIARQSQPVAPVTSELDDAWGEPEVTPTKSRRGNRSHESIPPILESPAAKPDAASAAKPDATKPAARPATDALPTAPVRLPTGVVATNPIARPPTDAIPTSQLRPPTGVVVTSPIRPLPGAAAPASTSRLAPIAPPRAGAPASSATAAPNPPSLIPSTVRSALSAGGMKPKPLPPVPPPPSARPRARRVTIAMDLRVTVAGRELAVQSRDVSASGLFAVTNEELPIGAVLEAELSVPSSGLSEESHRIRLRVVRRSKIGYGCELVEPSADLADALSKLGTLGTSAPSAEIAVAPAEPSKPASPSASTSTAIPIIPPVRKTSAP